MEKFLETTATVKRNKRRKEDNVYRNGAFKVKTHWLPKGQNSLRKGQEKLQSIDHSPPEVV